MKEKSVSELKAMLDNKEDFQLIDVREPHEAEICSIDGARLIPMNDVPDHIGEIAKDKRSPQRSYSRVSGVARV
jgi:rhodanese-related sulfurtransferase